MTEAQPAQVTPYHGDGAVPAVDGAGEVEGRDNADHAERVVALEQRVVGPLRGEHLAVDHAGQADRVVTDVDVLLDLADPLRHDLT